MTARRVPLRRLFKVINGGTPPSDEANWGDDVPWATPADFGESLTTLRSTRRRLTAHGAQRGSTIVPKDAILLSTRAPIGYVALAGVPMAFNQGCRALVPRVECDPRFFGYQLEAMRPRLQAFGLGSTFLELSSDDLASVSVAAPSKDKQRRSADFLDAETSQIDKLHRLTRQQSELLRDKLFQHMRLATSVSGGSNIQGIDTSRVSNSNSDWRLAKVSHSFATGSGTTPTSTNPAYFEGPHPWINSADINDSEVFDTERTVSDSAISEFPALKIYPPNSLVVALYGQGRTKGRVGILRIPACVNQACCVLIPTGLVSVEFAFYWFRAHKKRVISLAVGAGQPNLSQELIRQLRIPAPSLREQQAITQELREVEQTIHAHLELLESRERLLVERRVALITATMNNEFDVSSASGRGVLD